MKRLNFNIKDRKVLTLGLCLVVVCVFTLTIAYAALNAVLTISGNARVSAADWDIYLANPKVTNGSATTTVPSIKTSSTVEFSTTLSMPGDFYEFTIDVVNGGSIDAMIENVVKTPELTADQVKFLKYEITYQNGESITNKQLLAKDTTMPIKVRIEYRKDLVASDLPTGQVVLDLALTLEYTQSDGTASAVTNNGVYKPVSANGSLDAIGTIVTIGDQQFYTIGTEGDNVKLLSMYNLYVGGEYNNSNWTAYGDEATGKQDSTMLGYVSGQSIRNGTTSFSNTNSTYAGSIVEGYVNNYKTILEKDYGVDVVEARLISYDELTDSETFACVEFGMCSSKYPWIYSTSYWSGSANNAYSVWGVLSDGNFGRCNYDYGNYFGVRPVIIISKSNF